jgi:hypothetical protein
MLIVFCRAQQRTTYQCKLRPNLPLHLQQLADEVIGVTAVSSTHIAAPAQVSYWHQATDCRKSQFGRYLRHSGHAANSSGAKAVFSRAEISQRNNPPDLILANGVCCQGVRLG